MLYYYFRGVLNMLAFCYFQNFRVTAYMQNEPVFPLHILLMFHGLKQAWVDDIYIFAPFLQNDSLESCSQRYRKYILLQRQTFLASLDASKAFQPRKNRSNSSFVSLLQRSFPTFTHSLFETQAYTNDTTSVISNHTQRYFQLNRLKARIPIIFPIYFYSILFNLEKANL